MIEQINSIEFSLTFVGDVIIFNEWEKGYYHGKSNTFWSVH
jgi:hypothetical protein